MMSQNNKTDEKKKDDRKFKKWGDLERQVRGQIIRIISKLVDNDGTALLYEGTFIQNVGKYFLLKNVRLYKYNLIKNSKELVSQYNILMIKEDVISNIELTGINIE